MSVTEIIDNIIVQLNELKERLNEADKEFNEEIDEPEQERVTKDAQPRSECSARAVSHEPNKRLRTNFLNKSKFLNDEQRTIVLDYMSNNDNIAKIKELPSHRRVTYVQKQLLDQHGIHLSFYMTQKLLKGL